MSRENAEPQASFPVLVALTALFIYLCLQAGPIMLYGQIQTWPAFLYALLAMCGTRLAIVCLERIAHGFQWLGSRTPTGRSGTASWAKRREVAKEIIKSRSGPFWGLRKGFRKQPLFIGFVSNAMTIAPAGSGKGIYTVVPQILSIRDSKIIADFKGELICMLKTALEKRGEKVRVLNPGGIWSEIVGKGDSCNPLDIIADDLTRPGGLRDVMDDLREMCAQILPEPGDSEGENTYFREGSRRIIADVILYECMLELHDATLSTVALLIEDRTKLEGVAGWVTGLKPDGSAHPDGPLPIEQSDWAALHDPEDLREFHQLVLARFRSLRKLMQGTDTRTFDSFITGSQQALAPFAFGRIAPAVGRSTFRMSDLKEGKNATSLFIVADASRPESYKAFVGLVQWHCMTAIKRHKDKERPVYAIMDEATNYRVNGLESLLTWGRSYGLRLHLIFQNLESFEREYGKTALDTLLSETEVKQFLPGQRSPKTLELISKKILGEQSVISKGTGESGNSGTLSENVNEAARPLMTEDEIRRTRHGILIVRGLNAILFDPVSYAAIHPWRIQVGINPFHGKPFLKKIKLILRGQNT